MKVDVTLIDKFGKGSNYQDFITTGEINGSAWLLRVARIDEKIIWFFGGKFSHLESFGECYLEQVVPLEEKDLSLLRESGARYIFLGT